MPDLAPILELLNMDYIPAAELPQMVAMVSEMVKCFLCEGPHPLVKCPKLLRMFENPMALNIFMKMCKQAHSSQQSSAVHVTLATGEGVHTGLSQDLAGATSSDVLSPTPAEQPVDAPHDEQDFGPGR